MSAVPKTARVQAPTKKRVPVKPKRYEWLESDGEPLETSWHPLQIALLIALLEHRWRGRDDFYVGGNMFIYYTVEQAKHIRKTRGRTTRFKGPDFFYVRDVPHFPPRPYWVVWDEDGRYPNLIVELLSRTTAKTDRTTKKELYEQTFRTPEYFLYDFDGPLLEGWRLGAARTYRKIRPDARGWMWSQELGLWVGIWHGTYLGVKKNWLRFYDEEGKLLPLSEEEAVQRAETEKQRAEAEKQRAEAEKQRADAAEAELAQLRARLVEVQGKRNGNKRGQA